MEVKLSKQLAKEINKKNCSIPRPILAKALKWVELVTDWGLKDVKKIQAYRDHALTGNRKGQRSVYLNMQWRLIYTYSKEEIIVTVEEITPHKY
jgi:proteic killer suppression protein